MTLHPLVFSSLNLLSLTANPYILVLRIEENLPQYLLAHTELFNGDAFQGFFEGLVGNDARAFFQLLAVLGQMYQIGSAVFLVRYAHDEMLTLHIVYQARHAGLVFESCITQLLLRHPVLFP